MAVISDLAANGTHARRAARVMIVDDHPLVCRGLEDLFASVPDLEVSHKAGGLVEARKLIEGDPPDILLLDLMLGEGDSVEFIREIHERLPSLPILVLSMHEEQLHAERVLRAGARGYMEKEEPAERVVEAIREVLAGRVHLSSTMADRMMMRVVERENSIDDSPLEMLSKRETEVFRLLGRGVRTGDIAEQLQLSVKTVETYRDRIKTKLGLKTTTELVRYAVAWSIASDT